MRTRSERRHFEQRQKARARKFHGGTAKLSPRHLGRAAHSPQSCSCWMCGNPRRFVGAVTIQERRAQTRGSEFFAQSV